MTELTSPLDLWRVSLRSGHVVEIAAHAASDHEGWLTFYALAKGTPNFEIAVAAFPTRAVADWEGGGALNGTLPTPEAVAVQRSAM